jgi:hypothetical protein
VSGALTSSAGIVSTASQGISQSLVSLSGNDEFARNRIEARRRAQDRAQEGVLSGLLEGGGSVLQGIGSGITGLVSIPLSASRDSGITGLVTGLGMGVMNVGVSPILGVSDGLNSVAQTVMTQVNVGTVARYRRPPHDMHRMTVTAEDGDTTSLIESGDSSQTLEVSLIGAAPHKPLIRKQSDQQLAGIMDQEHNIFPILADIGNNCFVILAKKYLHIKRLADDPSMHGGAAPGLIQVSSTTLRDASLELAESNDVIMRWRDVSHFSLSVNAGICVLQMISCNEGVPGVDIHCQDPKAGMDLARSLLLCSRFMRNPNMNPDLNVLTRKMSSNYLMASQQLSQQSYRQGVANAGAGVGGAGGGNKLNNGEFASGGNGAGRNALSSSSFACPSNSLLYMNSLSFSSPLQSRSPYALSAQTIRIDEESVEEQQRPKFLAKAGSQVMMIGVAGHLNGKPLVAKRSQINVGSASSYALNNHSPNNANNNASSPSKLSDTESVDLGDNPNDISSMEQNFMKASQYKFGTANEKPSAQGTTYFFAADSRNDFNAWTTPSNSSGGSASARPAYVRDKSIRNINSSSISNLSSNSANANNNLFRRVEQELALINLFIAENFAPRTGRLESVSCTADAWQRIDEIMWQIIKEWTTVFSKHNGSDVSRCSCLALVNESQSLVVLNNVQLKFGRGVKVLPGPGYIPHLNSLVPGGCVLVLVWGDIASTQSRPKSVAKPAKSLLGVVDGRAKAYIESSSFSLSLSTKRLKVRMPHATTNSKTVDVTASASSLASPARERVASSGSVNNNNKISTEIKESEANMDDDADSDDESSPDNVEFLENASGENRTWCKFVVRVKSV